MWPKLLMNSNTITFTSFMYYFYRAYKEILWLSLKKIFYIRSKTIKSQCTFTPFLYFE